MGAHLLLQLTDLHLSAVGALRNGARPGENFEAALAHLGREDVRPDLIVLTGDLTDDGDSAGYAELRIRLAPLAEATGAAVVYLPGNHDVRASFRRHLLQQDARDPDAPINQVVRSGGLRLIALDSSVPGAEHGELADATLAFLAHELAEPAPDGTVLALHHPPVGSPIASMNEIALRSPERLGEVVGGTDVRLIIAGHNHHEAAGALAGIPVWVSPALAYLADVGSTAEFRPFPGAALTRIDLPTNGQPLVTVIHVPLASSRF